MKATVDRKALHEALRTVTPIAGQSHVPVTTGLRIDAADGVLVVTATNLDLTIRAEIGADVDEPGIAIPPARLMSQFIASGAGDVVTLESEDDRLNVAVGEAVMSVSSHPTADWPQIERPQGEEVVLTASDLDLIGRVLHACHVDIRDPKPGLSSVHLEGDRVEATDGYRAAVATLGVSGLPSMLVPPITLRSILKVADGHVTLVSDGRLAEFAIGSVTWTTRLIVDAYPDLPSFMKRAEDACVRKFTVGREPLAAAIERAALVHDGQIRSITMTPELDTLLLSGTSVDVGEVSDRVPFSGDWVDRVKINVVYMRDAIDALTDDEIVIRGADALKPWAITSTDGRLRLLLMPVRV